MDLLKIFFTGDKRLDDSRIEMSRVTGCYPFPRLAVRNWVFIRSRVGQGIVNIG